MFFYSCSELYGATKKMQKR